MRSSSSRLAKFGIEAFMNGEQSFVLEKSLEVYDEKTLSQRFTKKCDGDVETRIYHNGGKWGFTLRKGAIRIDSEETDSFTEMVAIYRNAYPIICELNREGTRYTITTKVE